MFFFKYFLQLLQNKVPFLYRDVVQACCDGPFGALKDLGEGLLRGQSSGFLCVWRKDWPRHVSEDKSLLLICK